MMMITEEIINLGGGGDEGFSEERRMEVIQEICLCMKFETTTTKHL